MKKKIKDLTVQDLAKLNPNQTEPFCLFLNPDNRQTPQEFLEKWGDCEVEVNE